MLFRWLKSRKDVLLLILLWLLFFVPYILGGGLLRDDLMYLSYPPKFPDYFQYQSYLSSMETHNGRPLFALIVGICFWVCGTDAWKLHLVNLAMFGGSIFFFYLSLKRAFSQRFAFLAACAAMVYPCAASNVFSSVMTNNLTALFWSAALYVSTGKGRGRGIGIMVLFLLSALSYESFIPLFLLLVLLEPFLQKAEKIDVRLLIRRTIPLGLAVVLWMIYRVFIEFVVGKPSYRLALISPLNAARRYWAALMTGVHITVLDSLRLSVHALRDLPLVPALQWIFISMVLGLAVVHLYTRMQTQEVDPSLERPFVRRFLDRFTTIRISGLPYLDLFVISAFMFCCSFSIYAVSDYTPVFSGFDNRTLGAVRFMTALLAAAVFQIVFQILSGRRAKIVFASISVVLFLLFSFSMIGQREAWIAAAHYNEKLLGDVNAAITASGLRKQESFTLVVEMPETFPGEVNKEPIFGWPWDIGTALYFSNPGINIKTLVYNASQTSVTDEKILIYSYYESGYPFYFYSYKTGMIVPIYSKQDWERAMEDIAELDST